MPAAFGGSFPTQDAGPGQVALFTGEFQVSETDVSVPGYGGDLTIGRSHRSLAGASTPAAEVFGPGWVADLEGPEAGQASMEVIDRTATSASITLLDPEGESSTYVHEDDTASPQRVGFYDGDLESETDNDVLEIETRSGTKYLTLFEEDGTETEWRHLGDGQWVINSVEEPFSNGTTTYTHDSDGLVTGIYAPAPSGVTCTEATQQPGCRALQLTYTTIDGAKRLSQVDLRTFDPKPGADGAPTGSAGMVTVPVAKYEYNASGVLTGAWDPRLGDAGSALKTTYEYTTAGSRTHLTKATPAGEVPWRFEYESNGRLANVKRAHPAAVGSGDATWRIAYSTALSGTGLPNVQAAATRTWGQDVAPVGAATVYGPDAPATPAPSDGTISYWDVEGRTLNVASYGAGAWQIDSKAYDEQGNEIWALDEGNRNLALTSGGDSIAVANSLATLTTYNEERPGIPAGTRVETVQGPTRQVMLDNGDVIEGRALTSTVYDDEAADQAVPAPGRPAPDPETPAMNLAVEERAVVADVSGTTFDRKRTRFEYAPIVAGDGNGWESGSATRTKTELGSGWSTEITRTDTDGKVVETRTPQGVAAVDGTANDTRSRKTIYYTADASAADAACRNKPQWAGLECLVGPAGQPGGNTIPVTRTTGFDYLLSPTRSEETSGSMTRTSVTGYHVSGRTTLERTTMAGAPTGDQAVADTTYAYSPTTGAVTGVSSGGKTQATTYDSWGRELTKSDGSGNTAATTYDTAGRVRTFNDGKGTYTYTYDGTDAAGKVEKRGLVTKLKVGLASGADEFTVANNADGNSYLTRYPNGVRAITTFDAAGTETALSYVDGADTEIVAFSNVVDRDSKVRTAESPASAQTYTYDGRDRLTQVQDTTAEGCTTRTYGFSLDSNRTSLATAAPSSDGACTTTGASTVTSAFDAADRITTSGYAYDNFGRTRTVPAAHTDAPDGSSLTVGYHANDMVARLAQTVPGEDDSTLAKVKTFTLDPAARLSTTSDTEAGVEVRKTTNWYADAGDAPAWITTQARPNASTAWANSWTRNVLGPNGDLAMIQGSDETANIQIANLHGDIVTQIPVSSSTGAIDAYAETTEYGLARVVEADLGQNYGWLGAKRRSTDSIGGLTLMGVRLYNPVTGLFLSMDPVHGGNDNTYTYPPDPVNSYDLDGKWRRPRWVNWRNAARVGGAVAFGACVFASAGACAIAGVGAAALSARSKSRGFRTRTFRRHFVRQAAWSIGGASAGGHVQRVYSRWGRRNHWSRYKANVGLGAAQHGASSYRRRSSYSYRTRYGRYRGHTRY